MRIFIPLIFLVLAAWFILGSGSGAVPSGVRAEISPADIDPAESRRVMGDPPSSLMGGVEMSCDACHGIFESGLEESERRQQHLEIKLEHGLNARCFNCHSRENRNRLILPGSVEIGFAQAEQLCASCHGPTFRDWSAGIHGKSRGSWEIGSPARRLMLCTECHDPHHPAFRPVAPLPAPETLRMHATERNPIHRAAGKRNPLRRQRSSSAPLDHE
ncbi:MAG: hypothetical protein ACI9F9_001226 [Candidatus Paceibacteria bacterium]|jgi:hypothetical protein